MHGFAGCLDGISTLENLQSLKLYGNLVRLPEWIQGLRSLVKLKLRNSRIVDHSAAIQVLGKLPNLAILCLWMKSFEGSTKVTFSFYQHAFPSLVVLHLDRLYDELDLLQFSLGAAPKLEVLQLSETYIERCNGLPHLPRLKEVVLKGGYASVDSLRTAFADHPNRPVVQLN
jgi:hypothetical protein